MGVLAADIFTVETAWLRTLYVFFVIEVPHQVRPRGRSDLDLSEPENPGEATVQMLIGSRPPLAPAGA